MQAACISLARAGAAPSIASLSFADASAANRPDAAMQAHVAACERQLRLVRRALNGPASGPVTAAGECAVCMEQMYESAIGSCVHHFCCKCLLETCALVAQNPACPKCRTPVRELRPDPEFDAVLAAMRGDDPAERHDEWRSLYTVTLTLPPGTHAGMTVKRWKHGPGVRVRALEEADQGYLCGLRIGETRGIRTLRPSGTTTAQNLPRYRAPPYAGDVVVSVNSAAVTEADELCEYINLLSSTKSLAALTLLVLPRPGGAEAQVGARRRRDAE